jgi:hypothetical protein
LKFLTLAAATAIAALTADKPMSADETPSAGDSAMAAATTLEDRKAAARKRGYRLVVKSGVEYYCKREALTGSRLAKSDICLTQEQMDNLRENSQEFLRDAQSPAWQQTAPNQGAMGPGT